MLVLTKRSVQMSGIFSDMHNVMIEYLLNNFADPLGFTEITENNLPHFIDGLMAHRSFFRSLNMQERVDEINYYLDDLARRVDPEGKIEPAHHDHTYREPVDTGFLYQFDLDTQLDRFSTKRRLPKAETKFLERCKNKNALKWDEKGTQKARKLKPHTRSVVQVKK